MQPGPEVEAVTDTTWGGVRGGSEGGGVRGGSEGMQREQMKTTITVVTIRYKER